MSSMPTNYNELPTGRAPQPVPAPHFPDTLHAVVWRNWDIIDMEALADVLEGTPEQIAEIARSMGLPAQRQIPADELSHNYMTFLRHNWHLLPYEQLCRLLGWSAAHMQYSLNEDDCLWSKLGAYKPECPKVLYREPGGAAKARAAEIAATLYHHLGDSLHAPAEPPFGFLRRFSSTDFKPVTGGDAAFQMRMVYPYFLRYGDPLAGDGIDDIPEAYLAEMAASGINALWMQGVLNTLAPWGLAPELSEGWQERLANLNTLIERCGKYGIEVLLYLNEPRAMPPSFFEKYPHLRGVKETPQRADSAPDVMALCVSTPEVQEFLVNAVRHVFENVPRLGGVFTITYSENLTNCYSREYGPDCIDEFALKSTSGGEEDGAAAVAQPEATPCPRCEKAGPEATNALVCQLLERGMREAGSTGKFILYVWSTPETWVPGIIDRLPASTWVQCISEWGKIFTRGDYTGPVNEYSISVVGPSEQSLRQWKMARKRGLKLSAKMQAANTFEVSSIPYIPAMRLVAEHLHNVTEAGVDGIMAGWTAGGSPSPNLELVAEFVNSPHTGVEAALQAVAVRRFGEGAAREVVRAWNLLSDAYLEFPFDIWVCYNGPQSLGPANLVYGKPTNMAATMVTFPFDDLNGWCGPYSNETFTSQFRKLADGWQQGVDVLDGLRQSHPSAALEEEWSIAEALRIHFRSTANQARYIMLRETDSDLAAEMLRDEIDLSRRLFNLIARDSRIGYEASNHYAYQQFDLAEKILNCEQLLQEMKW